MSAKKLKSNTVPREKHFWEQVGDVVKKSGLFKEYDIIYRGENTAGVHLFRGGYAAGVLVCRNPQPNYFRGSNEKPGKIIWLSVLREGSSQFLTYWSVDRKDRYNQDPSDATCRNPEFLGLVRDIASILN